MSQISIFSMNNLLNIDEVAELLNVSLSTLRRWDKEWKLKAIRVWKGHRKYDRDSVYSLLIHTKHPHPQKENTFTFVDLFAGIWGFHTAFSKLWGECVSAVEIDKPCRITYEYNYYKDSPKMFDNGYFYEDIRKVDENTFPDCDILCWGFPCQAFSIAWYQKWFNDPRWNLFFDVARLIDAKKPKVIFLENVKNLVSHDDWNTFKVILDTLKNLWYFVKHKVLNSYEYGDVPQNRERIYIIGFRNEESYAKFEFPNKIELTKSFTDLLDDEVDNTFYYNGKSLFDRIKDDVKRTDTVYQWRRQYVRENKKWLVPTLTANMGTGGHNVPIILDNKWIRKLTPNECVRMQWFPDYFKFPKLWNSQLYKQAWNSVSVPVLERIGQNILSAM